MEGKLTPEEERISQDVGGAIFIFVGAYMFFKGQADGLTFGILLIMGFGISQDIRNFTIFLLKYAIAKFSGKKTPSYDFSQAHIVQKSKRDSIVNYGTINYKD